MSIYNPQIHHRQSIRLQGYDYSQEGLYFITLCCQDRAHLFGRITKGEMVLNDAGIIADACWMDIPKHFPNAVLHEYIVMPNHVHGIIELSLSGIGAENFLPRQEINIALNETGAEDFLPRYDNIASSVIGAENFQPRQRQEQQNEFQKMIPRSIGSIVKGFKIGVTKWFRNQGNVQIIWQRNYYEHIIRNHQAYQRISEYIINNPAKWSEDKFYLL